MVSCHGSALPVPLLSNPSSLRSSHCEPTPVPSLAQQGSDLSSGDGSESEFRFSRHGGLGGGGDSVEGGAAGRVLNATLTGFECGSNCELTAACFDSMRQ